MAKDIEVIEAPSEINLKQQVKEYIMDNVGRVTEIEYDSYPDYETEELVYVASIFLS